MCTMVLIMAFLGNLKSSLVKKNFEKRTMTLEEIFEKDLVIHLSRSTLAFFTQESVKESKQALHALEVSNRKTSVTLFTRVCCTYLLSYFLKTEYTVV